ncbi:MAG: SDR family oxidoreductase, partial [Ketobacter sp.]
QYAAYLLSKKSLAEYTKMAALEFAPEIRVNGIAPGVTLPGETRGNAYVDWRIAGIPLGKKGSDEQLTNSLSYLLQNDFITGQILYVDGGESVNQVGRNHENYPDSA